MQYNVLTEEELKKTRGILSAGKAQFQIMNAEPQVSKKGNEQIKITLKCWDEHGVEGTVYDYLVSIPSMQWKMKQFCEAISHPYESGQLEPYHCEKKMGECVLKMETSTNPSYPGERLVIASYVPLKKSVPKNETKKSTDDGPEIVDDDIPF